MGLTLAKIAQNTATVTFQYELMHEDGTRESQPVTLVYYPARVTEKTLAVMNPFGGVDVAAITAGFHDFNEALVNLVKSWDVYEDDAQTVMFPLDVNRLGDLPLFFRVQVLNAIMEDIRPETLAPQMNGTQS